MNASPPPHPTDQILYDYGLGKLGDPDASAVDSHLEGCDACRQRVSELSGDSFLGRLRDAGARPETPAPGSAPSEGAKKADGASSPAPVPSPDPDLAGSLPAELVDNPQYQMLRELGRGGMGVVYLARNTLMDRLEVLKVLNKEMLERKGTYDRFLREVRAAARLAHLHVVGAYSAVQVGHLLVFAMEYVEGLDLAQLVESRGPLPVAHACSFAAQAALGLQHAHERGMVHRDIKPANLMLTRQGQRGIVKILDFGLAKASSENPIDGGLTREGQMLGTPHYISPEQTVDAQNADIRADIYSLGCTLYYLLTGSPPFDGTSLLDILQAHHWMEARPLNLVRPEVPVELAAVVGTMMAKERERRYQTPTEVAEALKPFFKPKVVGSGSSDGERSQLGQQEVERTSAGVGSAASEPAVAAPVAAPGAAVPPNDPALMWKSLVAIAELEHLSDARPPAPEVLRGRPPWLGPALAVGIVLLLGLVVGWAAGIIKFETEVGDLVLSGLPEHAVVTVDGKLYTVEWPGGKGAAKVTVPVGEHRVKVELDGVEVYGEEVKIATGEKTQIRVTIERHPAPPLPRWTPPPPRPPIGGDTIIANSVEMKLVLIPAGEFLMGSPSSDKDASGDEKPQHRVRITRPFYLGATEVTQGQYRSVTGQSPSTFNGSDDLPVERVSWFDAVQFCNAISAKERLTPYYRIEGISDKQTVTIPAPNGDGYRLPTEAEWEYACRGGSTTRYSFGDDAARLGEFAWYDGNLAGTTHPVGKKRPNAWDLYDMHGNVWEWCWDGFAENYYGQAPGADPLGPSQASDRVVRGGGWRYAPRYTRSADRNGFTPESRYNGLGFRVARVQSEASPLPPPIPGVIVKPHAPPIEERKPAPTALVPNAQPTPTSEEANPWPQALTLGGLTVAPNGSIIAMSRDGRILAQKITMPPKKAFRFIKATEASNPTESEETNGTSLWGAALTPDGKYLASHGDEGYIQFWGTTTGKEVRRIPHGGRVVRVAFSPDGTRFATVTHNEARIKVWTMATGALQRTLTGHTDSPWSAAFSPDGARLATCSGPWKEPVQSPGEVKVWNLQTGACTDLAGHSMRASDVTFSPNGRYLASAGFDKTAKVWDLKTLQCVTTFEKHPVYVTGVRFSPDGRLVASRGREKIVRIWEAATGREVASLAGLPGAPAVVEFSPEGRWIFAGAGKTLKTWAVPPSPQNSIPVPPTTARQERVGN